MTPSLQGRLLEDLVLDTSAVPLPFICRQHLHNAMIGRDLLVDFMPDDEAILSFANCWYRDALQAATDHALPSSALIRVVPPNYLFATKLEAYKFRARTGLLGSRDIEDILAVVDGRDNLHAELAKAESALQHYIAHAISALLAHRDVAFAVQSAEHIRRHLWHPMHWP